MKKNKILLSEPVIPIKETIALTKRVLDDNFPNEGKFTKLFENKLSKLLNVRYVVTSTSGTISIFLALKAVGIKEGDEVIVPNLTFPATANAVMLTGGKPILVDVNKKNLLIDEINLLKKITKKTKAIIPVHISGRGSNIKKILKIVKYKKIFVIEDAAEAFMSKIDGKYLGTFGDIGCFSFAPNKVITTGQGGLTVTNNKLIYKNLCELKDQGRIGPTTGGEDIYNSVGYNFKYTNLQAVLGLTQLKTLNRRIKILKDIYRFYEKRLTQTKKFKLIGFNLKKGELPLWTDVYSSKRNKLFEYLKKQKIICRYFWYPLNTCKPYKKSFFGLKNSKLLNRKLMWLPSSLNLKKKDLIKICYYINKFNLK
jgi:perosamine synthetase|tara:strand:+ start:2364 stop:3467 length:1104 start_codon:yes stop_codon:yes gene_type:complete